MKFRQKLFTLVVFYAAGLVLLILLSFLNLRNTDIVQQSINLGVELQIKSREVQSYMKDIVFDLFAPKIYGQTRSLTYSPRSAVTLNQWQEAVLDYSRTFNDFMKLDFFVHNRTSLIRDQYYTALRMNERAMEMLSQMEETLILLRDQYRTVDNLYNEMQKTEELTPFFNEFQETSFYFKNNFESFMNYFIHSLGEEAARIRQRMTIVYTATLSFFFLISLSFAVFLSRDLNRKLMCVENAFRAVSKGDFTTRMNIDAHDEFGLLSGSFNELLGDLKQNVDSILNLTRDVGGALDGETDMSSVYSLITRAVVQDTRAEGAAVLRRTISGEYFFEGQSGDGLESAEIFTLIEHLSRSIITPRFGSSFVVNGVETGLERLESLAVFPLFVEGRNFGFLAVWNMSGEEAFSDLALTRFITFSEFVSLTIDNYLTYRELIERREARYQALQAQVKPHFINNILGIILSQNRKEDREGIGQTVSSLRNMLSYVQSGESWASLEEETDFLQEYCRLQTLRFGPRITYEIKLDDKVRHVRVPRLLLQPLLENALTHGLEPRMEESAGVVKIRAEAFRRRAETGAVITIEDNGVGFDSSGWERKGNIGLLNARDRLRIAFPESEMTVDSLIGEGTTVRIVL